MGRNHEILNRLQEWSKISMNGFHYKSLQARYLLRCCPRRWTSGRESVLQTWHGVVLDCRYLLPVDYKQSPLPGLTARVFTRAEMQSYIDAKTITTHTLVTSLRTMIVLDNQCRVAAHG